MTRIDIAELNDVLHQYLTDAGQPPKTDSSKTGSLMRPADDILNAEPRGFNDVYAQGNGLLDQVARFTDDAGLSQLATRLAEDIAQDRLNLTEREAPAPRILSFVYPVV
ncbi:hypothetical protein [Tateyamaria omphalii]|uniref:Uncharacterized protein n=1 Tax=Tateyamaria omphalii TaxID=299262 RepID=A0A1P8N1W8_9RHOB|nr:hypothetical protein [Tateyamaria omphalii]APX14306.1 hypothetical protein BWR18_20910 [Tateyamaria omphalii]